MTKKAVSKKPPNNERLPANWPDISVGCLVLSLEDDIADGFWPAIAQAVKNDGATLKWQKRLDRRPFKKSIADLGLLWPGQDMTIEDATTAGGDHPVAWSAVKVGSLVLAREDGPMAQFWLSQVTEQLDEHSFILHWVGYPDIPPVTRHRHDLGLLHPARSRAIKLRQPKLTSA